MRILLLTLLVSLAALLACEDSPTASPPIDPGSNDTLFTGIFFSRHAQAGTRAIICRINADGSGLDSLTDTLHLSIEPDISQDGQYLAFASNHFSSRDIVIMKYNDTSLTRLTSLTGIEADPTWSPDRSRLLFTEQATIDAIRNIYVINADGTGVEALTTGTTDFHSPVWSPTSADSLFFFGPGGQLHMMNLHDQGSIIIPLGIYSPTGLDFSPSDSIFLCQADIEPNPDSIFWQIFRGDLSGLKPTDISALDMYDLTPKWSPDGSQILFRSNGSYEHTYDDGLYLCEPSGEGRTHISGTGTYDYDPCWSPKE